MNKNFFDVLVEHITHGAVNEPAFFMDQLRSHRCERDITDLIPKTVQIFVVSFDFGFCAFRPRGANNQAHAFWHFEFLDHLFQAFAVAAVCNLA